MVNLTATGLAALLAISAPAIAAPPPLRATSINSSTCVGNNHLYHSGLSYNIKGSNYIVHCGKDSTGASAFSKDISRGDFTSCFRLCEVTKGCDGFTYISGKKNGICYFKSDVGDTLASSDDVITCKKDHDGPRGLEPELDPSGLPQHGLGHHTRHPGHWIRPEGRLESRAVDMNDQDSKPTATHSHHTKSKNSHSKPATDSGSALTQLNTSLSSTTSTFVPTNTERPMLNSSPQWCKDWVIHQKLQHLRVLVQWGNRKWDGMWLKDPPRDGKNSPAMLTNKVEEAVNIFIHPETKGLVSFRDNLDDCSLRYFHMVAGTHECIWSEYEPEYLISEGGFDQNSYLEPYLVVNGRKDWGDWLACDFGEGFLRVKYWDTQDEFDDLKHQYVCAILMFRLDQG